MTVTENLRSLYTGSFRRLVAQVYFVTDDLHAAQQAVFDAFVRAQAGFRKISKLDDPERRLRTMAVRGLRRRSMPWRHRGHSTPVRRPVADPILETVRGLPDQQRLVVGLGLVCELPLIEVAELLEMSYSRAEHHLRAGQAGLGAQVTYAERRSARLALEDAVEMPPYTDLQARSRPRRIRRISAAGAVLVLAAGAGLVAGLWNRDHHIGPGTAITQVKFVDRSTGYAVLPPCRGAHCSLRLAVTTDGGAHWQQRVVPTAEGHLSNVVLTTCCGRGVALDYTRDTKQIHMVSDDGGRTWEQGRSQSAPLRGEQPTPTLPNGWIPITGLDGRAGLSALDTVHRVARPLTHQPSLPGSTVVTPYAPGDRIWAFGGGVDSEALDYSDDHGVTWVHRDGPPLAHGESITTLFPTGGGGVYVQAQNGPKSTPQLWWEGASSHQWQRLPSSRLHQAWVAGVLPNDELWISGPTGSWRTEQHGRAAVPMDRPTINGTALRLSFAGVTDGMIYATPASGERQDLVFTSTDARHWSTHVVRVGRAGGS